MILSLGGRSAGNNKKPAVEVTVGHLPFERFLEGVDVLYILLSMHGSAILKACMREEDAGVRIVHLFASTAYLYAK